jgi:hypothetical protein
VQKQPVQAMVRSELYQTWRERVVNDDNDYIVAIAASSRTPLSGTGKTTLGIQLAQLFDQSAQGFNATEKASLDSEHIADNLFTDLPHQSAIIFDEAQGTLGSDGVDSRKAMANAVVRMSRAAATFRYKQHTLIIIAQSTQWLDSRMMDLIDRLVLIQEKDAKSKYARAVTFDHYRDDLPSNTTADEYTPAIEDLYWEPEPNKRSDAFKRAYQKLHTLKEETAENDKSATSGGNDDAEMSDANKRRLVVDLYRNQGLTQYEIADHDMINKTQPWVSRVLDEAES